MDTAKKSALTGDDGHAAPDAAGLGWSVVQGAVGCDRNFLRSSSVSGLCSCSVQVLMHFRCSSSEA